MFVFLLVFGRVIKPERTQESQTNLPKAMAETQQTFAARCVKD
jgi:hypothetical protein